jgi:hypothetical protein
MPAKAVTKGSFEVDLLRSGPDEAQADRSRFAGIERQPVPRCGLGSDALRVDRADRAMHDVIVDAILDVRSGIRGAEHPLDVALVFGEQQLGMALAL